MPLFRLSSTVETSCERVRFLSAAIDFSAAQNWSSMLMLVLWPLMTMERLIIVDFMTRELSLLWSRVPVAPMPRSGDHGCQDGNPDVHRPSCRTTNWHDLIALRGPCERLQEVTQFFPSRLRRRCASRRRHIVTGRRLNWFRCNCSPKLGSLAHGAPPKVLPLVHFGIKAGSVNCLVAGEHGRIGHVHVAAARYCGVGNGAPFAAMGQGRPLRLTEKVPSDGMMRCAYPTTPQGRPLCNFSVYPDSDGAAVAA